MDEIVIRSRRGVYPVRFGPPFSGLQRELSEREHLLIDTRVAALYAIPLAAGLGSRSVLRIEASESSKSLEQLPDFATHLISSGVARDHVLLVVGGGVLQDIGAFLAGTLLRGLPWRFYPTTLLAQADSCIGSKSSINVGGYKNMLGTYTPPADVWIAPDVLATLSDQEVRSGLGEIIKTHIIAGWSDVRVLASEYDRLRGGGERLRHFIQRALEIKKRIIEVDEFDSRERLLLNYGHTFGHALESATDYAVPHGLAVTVGMDLANYLSWKLGMMGRGVFDELHTVLERNSDGAAPRAVPVERFLQALARDKKRSALGPSFVLVREPGRLEVVRGVDPGLLRRVCEEYFARLLSAVEQ